MAAHKTDVFCIVLVLTFLVYNLAYSGTSNGIDILLQSKESCFVLSIVKEKLGNAYLKMQCVDLVIIMWRHRILSWTYRLSKKFIRDKRNQNRSSKHLRIV